MRMPMRNIQCCAYRRSISFRPRLTIFERDIRNDLQRLSRTCSRPYHPPPSRTRSSLLWRVLIEARSEARKLLRKHPVLTPICLLWVAAGLVGFYFALEHFRTEVGEMAKRYPQSVADELRKALYYTNTMADYKTAMKHYRLAVKNANELGMDPFSDEVLGIKLQVAHLFEVAGSLRQATRTYEVVRQNCLEWLERNGSREELKSQRSKLLAKLIGIHVKLGEHYSDERIANPALAEERLVWAVTTMIKEKQQRELDGVYGDGESEDETWLSDEEVGGAFEALADQYASKRQHHLSTPLYLQAVGLCSPKSCHAATLMINLATSLALQQAPPEAGQPPATPAMQIDAAKTWASKALRLAQQIRPPERTGECDEACAVATINLGDFAMMEDQAETARRLWQEGKVLCKALGNEEGIRRAEEALHSSQRNVLQES